MPYRTKSGTHYHDRLGCHGADIPCDTHGLTPCATCCSDSQTTGRASSDSRNAAPAGSAFTTGGGHSDDTPPQDAPSQRTEDSIVEDAAYESAGNGDVLGDDVSDITDSTSEGHPSSGWQLFDDDGSFMAASYDVVSEEVSNTRSKPSSGWKMFDDDGAFEAASYDVVSEEVSGSRPSSGWQLFDDDGSFVAASYDVASEGTSDSQSSHGWAMFDDDGSFVAASYDITPEEAAEMSNAFSQRIPYGTTSRMSIVDDIQDIVTQLKNTQFMDNLQRAAREVYKGLYRTYQTLTEGNDIIGYKALEWKYNWKRESRHTQVPATHSPLSEHDTRRVWELYGKALNNNVSYQHAREIIYAIRDRNNKDIWSYSPANNELLEEYIFSHNKWSGPTVLGRTMGISDIQKLQRMCDTREAYQPDPEWATFWSSDPDMVGLKSWEEPKEIAYEEECRVVFHCDRHERAASVHAVDPQGMPNQVLVSRTSKYQITQIEPHQYQPGEEVMLGSDGRPVQYFDVYLRDMTPPPRGMRRVLFPR